MKVSPRSDQTFISLQQQRCVNARSLHMDRNKPLCADLPGSKPKTNRRQDGSNTTMQKKKLDFQDGCCTNQLGYLLLGSKLSGGSLLLYTY